MNFLFLSLLFSPHDSKTPEITCDNLLKKQEQCILIWHWVVEFLENRPRGYKTFFMLNMKFVLLINLRLLTIANSSLLNITEHENFSANKYENANFIFIIRENFMLNWVQQEKSL